MVDSFSTDRTVEIAQGLGARGLSAWVQGYVKQKQFALEQATGRLGPAAGRRRAGDPCIAARKSSPRLRGPQPADGYEIRRVLYHLGHYYPHAIYPDRQVRLFRREGAKFGGREPHAKGLVEGSVGKLRAPILHFSYRDIADHVATMNRLTTQSAAERDQRADLA